MVERSLISAKQISGMYHYNGILIYRSFNRPLLVLRGHSGFFHPRHNGQ